MQRGRLLNFLGGRGEPDPRPIFSNLCEIISIWNLFPPPPKKPTHGWRKKWKKDHCFVKGRTHQDTLTEQSLLSLLWVCIASYRKYILKSHHCGLLIAKQISPIPLPFPSTLLSCFFTDSLIYSTPLIFTKIHKTSSMPPMNLWSCYKNKQYCWTCVKLDHEVLGRELKDMGIQAVFYSIFPIRGWGMWKEPKILEINWWFRWWSQRQQVDSGYHGFGFLEVGVLAHDELHLTKMGGKVIRVWLDLLKGL